MKLSRLITTGFLSLILSSFATGITEAQDSNEKVSLLSLWTTQCNYTGGGTWEYPYSRYVSINNQLYNSIATAEVRRTTGAVVCKINLEETENPFETFRFTFGREDFEPGKIMVIVYLDGVETAKYKLQSGDIHSVLFDVSDTEDIAIEVKGSESYANLYIVQDFLER